MMVTCLGFFKIEEFYQSCRYSHNKTTQKPGGLKKNHSIYFFLLIKTLEKFRKQQFSTRLSLKGKFLEEVYEIKSLRPYINKDLKCFRNTNHLDRRAHSRMELLRQMKISHGQEV